MNNAKTIFKNTILLTGASFLMQTVGVAFNVWLTNRIGAAGIGLFQLVMTVYGLAVTLGCGGIRLGCTRLTVEAEAKHENSRKTVWYCVRYALVTGACSGVALYALTPIASQYWLGDLRAISSLHTLAFALPFVAMSSAMNGYFTAVGKVGRYAAVRIGEQAVKIAIVMLCMGHLCAQGEEHGSVAISIGIVGSEMFSFLCLLILYNMETQKYSGNIQLFTMKKLCHITVPDVTGAGARSVLLTIEHLLIPRGFRSSGVCAQEALAVYGNIHGMVFPLLLYPSAILSSLSSLLTPEIAGEHALRHDKQIRYIQRRVLRLTLIFGFGTAGIMFCFAQALSQCVYHTTECTIYLKILAPLVPVMYCDMTVDGLLKGLDEQKASMRYNILDSALCVVLVYFLLPRYAIRGYIFVLYISEIFNFYLSMRRLCKVSEVHLQIGEDVILPLGSAICASAFVQSIMEKLALAESVTAPECVCAILAALMLYVLFLYGFGSLKKEDAQWFRRILGVPWYRKVTRT